MLAKVLNNIGSSNRGLLAGFCSAGQNPLTSHISTHFMFQLSSWHHISLVTKRVQERMPKDLLGSKYAISSCLITGCGSQTLMNRPLELGAILIQPHSLYLALVWLVFLAVTELEESTGSCFSAQLFMQIYSFQRQPKQTVRKQRRPDKQYVTQHWQDAKLWTGLRERAE